MKKILSGLMATPALALGIVIIIISITFTVLGLKFNLEKDMISLEILGSVYEMTVALFILPAAGVAVKREVQRIFIRGER